MPNTHGRLMHFVCCVIVVGEYRPFTFASSDARCLGNGLITPASDARCFGNGLFVASARS
jgi:hypothetical protein